jgi:hypothetical protein
MMASLSGALAVDGIGGALRHRAKFCLSGPRGRRASRRRRDADERHQRADHRREVLEGMERPAADRARAQQPRPQHGDVGGARAGGDPKFSASQDLPDFPYAEYARLVGLDGVARSTGRKTSRRPGTRVSRRTGRSSSKRVTDPDVPPLPPHITLEQAKASPRRW